MAWPEVEMRSFLTERKNRFKPAEANALGLKRLEKIDFRGNMFVSDPKPTKTNMILIKKGDLVISGINAEKGALGIYDGNEDILATIHYSSYHYDKTKINIDYIRWFLKSSRFKQLLMEHAGGGIKTEIKPKKLLPLKLKLPDLITQEQIAIKLKSVANDFNQLTWINIENKDLTSQLRQAILQFAVQGKLVLQNPNDEPAKVLLEKIKAEKQRLIKEGKIRKQKSLPPIKDHEIPYKLPKGWEWTRLGDLSKMIHYGYTASAKHGLKDVRLLRITDIQSNKVDWEAVPGCQIDQDDIDKYELSNGDILIARTGGTIGKSYLVQHSPVCAVFASYLIRVIPSGLILSNYLKLFIESPLYWDQLYNKSMGTGQPNVNATSLKSLLSPLPPLNEQNRVVAKVDELMTLCAELEAKLIQAKADSDKLMASAIHHLLSRSPRMVRATTPYKDDAAVICLLLAEMERLHRPTTEFFIQKHIFAAKHHQHLPINSTFHRKAAGPWSRELKQKTIFAAVKMNWLRWDKNHLVAGPAFEKALSHAATVLGESAAQLVQLVENLKTFGQKGLERWTTVLKVVEDLKETQQTITRDNIQHEIDNWRDKRLKEIFAEESVDYTITKMLKHKWLPLLDKP